MPAADRLQQWVEGLSAAWRDRLRGWMASWVERSFREILETMEPETKLQAKSMIARLKANPATPPEVREAVERFEAGSFNPMIVVGVAMVVAMIVQTVQTLWTPGQKQMS